MDIREIGIGHSLDIIMYVFYSGDQKFIKDMVTKVTSEVIELFDAKELPEVLMHEDNLMLYKCLFFFMLDFHVPFRYWVLNETGIGLYQVNPYKAARFLRILREELIPEFLLNETMRIDEFENKLKIEYIRS